MSDNAVGEVFLNSLALDATMIESLKSRRSAGESLGKLARELGLPWQRLWVYLAGGTPTPVRKTAKAAPVLRATGDGRALVEKYRPGTLDALWGQDAVVKVLRKFAANPHSAAFIFEGETGTGKTSAALALAQALGCDMTQKPPEFGGVYVVASGEQSADAVRDIARQMWNAPFSGSGWKVVIVNECDRMALPAETVWLDRLEALSPRTVVVFTTNHAGKLSARFRDRCTGLTFDSDASAVEPAVRELLEEMWRAETGDNVAPRAVISKIIAGTTQDGQLSFRRAVKALAVHLAGRE